MALFRHNPGQPRVLRRALLFALGSVFALAGGLAPIGAALATDSTAPPHTHYAAVTRNSLPTVSKDARKLPIDVVSSQVDYRGDSVVFKDVVITQGETRVQADHAHATGLDNFDNSHWTFEGNVRINGEQHGSLKSDQAVVEFRNNRILKATAIGNPAEFEQKRADNDQTARGHAKEIVYNVGEGTVRMSGDAWLSDGHNEISVQELVYDIRLQQVQGAAKPGTDDKVHIIIDPAATKDDPNKNP